MRELAETSTKDLNIWRVCSVLVQIVACCSAGFWQGGPVAAGETKRAGIFETSNPLIRCQKSTRKVARVSVVLPSYFRIIGQIIGGDYRKFCGLLRIHELYT